jgi:hypothetical protein
MTPDETRWRIERWREASQRFYELDFLNRRWIAEAIADADVLIESIDTKRRRAR